MKASEINDLSVEELQAKQVELQEELFNLRFQLHTGHLENTARVSQVRKDVARVKTVLASKLNA
ncbi:LSU ribosomal protein L29P [Malonomonas rubra DSM 5091]|uniref:Large ribosomal subunit protein uL29 n=1 Tax=Malonomonas rubra DSM 5091 TaxID=1122189 RepID=A0A1M6MT01_MALRU|nr:50S ribosomal protein L29 [Malonomonas rubra]SHJ86574.1 LSU ribosomal protein L29P [Malonomonas rubra DSM 5091]